MEDAKIIELLKEQAKEYRTISTFQMDIWKKLNRLDSAASSNEQELIRYMDSVHTLKVTMERISEKLDNILPYLPTGTNAREDNG